MPEPDATITNRLAKPERGDILELRTDSLAFEGKAVARREDGDVVFVEGALGGEQITTRITKAKGSYAESKLVEILQPSDDRRTPICPYFGTCGGCSMQHMHYAAQLSSKTQHVRELFQRIGKFPEPPVRDIVGAENEY